MIDLRSDTVTRPTSAMYAAMASAPIGDDVLGDDPTVLELEQLSAQTFGFESALFCTSGTLCNQIALNVHSQPGDALAAEQHSHILHYEAGAPAALSGLLALTFRGVNPTPDELKSTLWQRSHHTPQTSVLCLENTHNRHGGQCIRPDTIATARALASENGTALHLDGARVVNAAVSLGCEVKALTSPFDSASVCLSKGLGAPVGSVLLGTEEFIERARFVRKRFGGGWRQAGLLAACGIVALREGPAALAEDHRRAQIFARRIPLPTNEPESNIVLIETRIPAPEALALLSFEGVALVPFGPHTLRAVWHRDLSDEHLEQAVAAFERTADKL